MIMEMKKMTTALGKVAVSVEKANTLTNQHMKFFRPCLNNIKGKMMNLVSQNAADVRDEDNSQPEAKDKESEMPAPPQVEEDEAAPKVQSVRKLKKRVTNNPEGEQQVEPAMNKAQIENPEEVQVQIIDC